MITKTKGKPGSVRRTRSDGRATREAILLAAEEEFAEKGYALASVRAISASAGVNIALANRYFGSKEDLYRIVAQRLFGDLGAPMAAVAGKVRDADSWRAAVREWVEDFLFMTLPTERPQRLCRGLFRHEVVTPSPFHEEFLHDYGEPIYNSLVALVSRVTDDPVRIDLLTSSLWSQIVVYALADEVWLASFRPRGIGRAEWRKTLCEQICETFFKTVE